jgi:tRNA/tmRNA/rRNA uracil-C5-methylase (TrmA/RlmC/RlmD family)
MRGETEVKKIIEGGIGLAFFEGRTVFLPYAAPGDRVEFSVRKDSGNILFSRIERILEPSGMRIEPECPNFTTCPGCEFLHLSYPDEVRTKQEMTAETFRRIGKIEINTENMITSPERFGYRNGVLFEFDREGRPGLRNPESGRVIPFPPAGCPLLSSPTREAVQELTGMSCRGDGPALARTDKFGSTQFWGVEGIIELPDILVERAGNLFPVKPGTPVRDNVHLDGKYAETIFEMAGDTNGSLVELFCGTGMISLALAGKGMKVTGIDSDIDSIEDARAAARLNEIEDVDFQRGRVDKVLKGIRYPERLLISPPPSGISKPLLRIILKKQPAEIIISSADAATLARDLKRLREKGYRLADSRLVDLYPARSSSQIIIMLERQPAG